MNGIGWKVQRLNPCNYGLLNYDKKARIYNGEKTVSSVSGALETRHLYVEK